MPLMMRLTGGFKESSDVSARVDDENVIKAMQPIFDVNGSTEVRASTWRTGTSKFRLFQQEMVASIALGSGVGVRHHVI